MVVCAYHSNWSNSQKNNRALSILGFQNIGYSLWDRKYCNLYLVDVDKESQTKETLSSVWEIPIQGGTYSLKIWLFLCCFFSSSYFYSPPCTPLACNKVFFENVTCPKCVMKNQGKLCFVLLKDKLRYIKFLKSLSEQALIQIRQHKTESGQGYSPTGVWERLLYSPCRSKARKPLDCYSLVVLLGKNPLVVDN